MLITDCTAAPSAGDPASVSYFWIPRLFGCHTHSSPGFLPAQGTSRPDPAIPSSPYSVLWPHSDVKGNTSHSLGPWLIRGPKPLILSKNRPGSKSDRRVASSTALRGWNQASAECSPVPKGRSIQEVSCPETEREKGTSN